MVKKNVDAAIKKIDKYVTKTINGMKKDHSIKWDPIVFSDMVKTTLSLEKKKKDPNAPKRAMNPFMKFANKHRDDVKSKHPNKTIGEIGKELGTMWRALTDAEKAKYKQI